MIFLDTSAVYALAARTDVNHTRAKKKFEEIVASGTSLLTHNYVLTESFSLLQSRLGLGPAVRFEKESRWFEIEWVTPEMHAESVSRWSLGPPRVSFVDQVSFLVMQRRQMKIAFAFDADFEDAGFRLF